MTLERKITKQKVCVEDLTLGTSTEVQIRNGTTYTLEQINTGSFPGAEAVGADLADISHSVNTDKKYKRQMIWDTTADKPLWAAGPLPADVWKDATGATVRTPI